ncbi:MAG: four helix bundle protein [Candidatus Pacebacteria bacterium]|jgi:four helix bundle protein|nr:four helix bundle protein [Candidatus Paceibacterota bacterium]
MISDTRKPIKSFTDLLAWQEGHKLVVELYKTLKKFPKEELYSLTDQMKRAAISITSNIAEGFGRQTYKEKTNFYYQAQGSLTELKNQILIAKDVDYLDQSDFDQLVCRINIVHRLLQGLIQKTKSFIIRK